MKYQRGVIHNARAAERPGFYFGDTHAIYTAKRHLSEARQALRHHNPQIEISTKANMEFAREMANSIYY